MSANARRLPAIAALFSAAIAAQTPFTIDTVFPNAIAPPGFGLPVGPTAVDIAGNLYISNSSTNRIFRRAPDGTITVIAGNGTAGFSGDGGPAISAQLNNPEGLAVDTSGNVFFVDTQNERIRRIDPAGNIDTIRYCGRAVFTIAADSAGNVYYPAFDAYSTLYRISPSGTATVVMGNAPPYFNAVTAIATDSADNLYVADLSHIYKRTPSGTVTTLFSKNDGVSIPSLAANAARGLCFSAYYRISCIDANGTVTTLAGTGTPGFGGDGGPASQALLQGGVGLSFDTAGYLYMADNARIRVVSPAGIISTLIKGTPAIQPQFPRHVAVDGSGNLYIADDGANVIWKVAPNGDTSVFAGTGSTGHGIDGSPATDFPLYSPQGIAVDSAGRVYVSDIYTHSVRVIGTDGIIRKVAGTGSAGFGGDGGLAANAALDTPLDLALDSAGNLYIADSYNNRVRRIDNNGIITTVAGSGTGRGWNTSPSTGDGGLATSAQLNNPDWVAAGPNGTVYVGESGRIRAFQIGGNISAFGRPCGLPGDGRPVSEASFCSPSGMAFDTAGNIYIVDQGRAQIRRVDTSGIVAVVAGIGTEGFSGDGGPALAAQFKVPWGIAVDSSGALYIADMQNVRVRKITGGTRCSLALSKSGGPVDAAAVADSLAISGSCAWSAVSDLPWLTITSGAQATGSGTVQYSIDTNLNSTLRSASIQVSAPGIAASFPVLQSGANCQYSLTPSQQIVGWYSSSGNVTINQSPANCAAWVAASDSPWLAISNNAVAGHSSVIAYNVLSNPTATSRTGHIAIGPQQLTVLQDPSAVVITSPAAGSTLPGPVATFSWTTGSLTYFTYTLGTTPGGSEIATGASVSGSVTIGGIPRNGNPVYFRLFVSASGFTSPIEAVYQTMVYTPPAIPQVCDYQGNQRAGLFLYDPNSGDSFAALSDGAGAFSYIYTPSSRNFDVMRCGNFRSGGRAGLIQYNSANALGYIGSGDGTGHFSFFSLFWSPGYDRVLTGDLNGDGLTDLVLHRSADGTTYTALSNGDGTFRYRYLLVSIGYTAMVLADFNGDGMADILFYRASDGLAHRGISDGTGGFTFAPVAVEPGYDFVDAAPNGDLLYYASATGATRFNGHRYAWSPGFTTARLLDFNADGNSDIAFYNKNNTLGYLGLGDGFGHFNFGSLFWGSGMDLVSTGDLNNDGLADVVIYNPSNGAAYTGLSTANAANPFTYRYAYWGNGKLVGK